MKTQLEAFAFTCNLNRYTPELRLDNTLPTGQSFRQRKTTAGEYVGVIGQRVVSMRQEEHDVLYRVHCRPSGGGGGGGGVMESATRDAAAVVGRLSYKLNPVDP